MSSEPSSANTTSTSSTSTPSSSSSTSTSTSTSTPSFSTKKTFTGKELDAETGLYYYGARYYDSRLARFISGDPVSKYTSSLLLFLDPQRFNTYSYANNNPIRYTDPDGRFAIVIPLAEMLWIAIAGTGAAITVKTIQEIQKIDAPSSTFTDQGNVETPAKPQITDQNPPKPETPPITIDPVPETKSTPKVTTFPSETGEKGENILYTPKSQEEKCLCSLMNKERVKNPSKTESPIWAGLENYKNGIKANGEKGKKREYYDWDRLHNEIEVYNGKGIHKGVMDPKTGKFDESKRKEGRNIKDKL